MLFNVSISQRLNILFIIFKIIPFFIIKLFGRLYVRVDILLICVKHLQWPHHFIKGWGRLAPRTDGSDCTKPGKWEVMYLCVWCIDPGKWEVMYLCVRCFDSGVCFVLHFIINLNRLLVRSFCTWCTWKHC
jgi:hypothetical protein